MNVLVVGGAGYIGSHTCKEFKNHGLEPVVYDDLSQGHRWAVRWGPLEEGDLLDQERLTEVLRRHHIEAVVHFAALASVGQSIDRPDLYYHVNVCGTFTLLQAMRAAGVERLVFSSSCAVYGMPCQERMAEDHPREPINPYGRSKKMIEEMLADYGSAFGLQAIGLRYFNAAGADPDGEIGESHDPETHLIPNALAVAMGRSPAFLVNGDDYETPDGTCIRDFIHVTDLAVAHRLALSRLQPGFAAFNLGTGQGASVREVLRAVQQCTGRPLPERVGARRPGDPPRLVADASRACDVLGWKPQHSSLDSIIGSAWRWTRR